LTIKSDDVKGRNLTYSAIVKGKPFPTPLIPESFKLLTKQLQGLGLGINVIKMDGKNEDINNYTSVISEEELKDTVQTDETTSVQTVDNDSGLDNESA
jgi:DNA-directed RNA polymerase subunit beta